MPTHNQIAGTVFEQLVGAVEKILATEGRFGFPKGDLAERLEIFLENHTDLVRTSPAPLRCEKRSQFWSIGTFREGSQRFHLAYRTHLQDDGFYGYCRQLGVTRVPPAIAIADNSSDQAA